MRALASPVPTQTMSGFDGATATAPRLTVASRSKTGVQVVPLLVVFHRPPEAVATYRVAGRPSTTARSTMRPPMLPGPRQRAGQGIEQGRIGGAGRENGDGERKEDERPRCPTAVRYSDRPAGSVSDGQSVANACRLVRLNDGRGRHSPNSSRTPGGISIPGCGRYVGRSEDGEGCCLWREAFWCGGGRDGGEGRDPEGHGHDAEEGKAAEHSDAPGNGTVQHCTRAGCGASAPDAE